MSDSHTPRLALPLLTAGQAQKEIAHNEALVLIDAALQGTLAGAMPLDLPPSAPEPGQCWIVGPSPQGAWAGHDDAVAVWSLGGWRFLAPREGMRLWAGEARGFAFYRDGSWEFGTAWGRLHVDGEQVVGSRGAAIMEPTGGTVVDDPARAAIGEILTALRAHGLIASD